MSLGLTRNEFDMVDPLERVEQALEEGGWQAERDEETRFRPSPRRAGATLAPCSPTARIRPRSIFR